MKKIKYILTALACIAFLSTSFAQSPAEQQVNTLEKIVKLNQSQRTQAMALYSAYFESVESMSAAQLSSAKTQLEADVNALLSPNQRALRSRRAQKLN